MQPLNSTRSTAISSSTRTQPIQRIKCIVLGSSRAGKTSFLRRWKLGTFEPTSYSTISADYYSSLIPFPKQEDAIKDKNEGKVYRPQDQIYLMQDLEIASSKPQHQIYDIQEEDISKATVKPLESISTKRRKKKKSRKTSKRREKKWSVEKDSTSRSKDFDSVFVKPSYVSLQMWDTAGLERFVSESTGLTSTLGDAFFRNTDAAVLVYDATSSRSFLQLIKWHSELLERIRQVNSWRTGMSVIDDDHSNLKSADWQIPVLVVGTKLDKVKAEVYRNTLKRTVPQRDIMGLKGKTFKGKESYYEYTVNERNLPQVSPPPQGNAITISYGLEGGSWMTDSKYLHAIKRAEDSCFPDRNMVSLWCRRNGLAHAEISALDGTGVNAAIESIVALVMSSQKKHETF